MWKVPISSRPLPQVPLPEHFGSSAACRWDLREGSGVGEQPEDSLPGRGKHDSAVFRPTLARAAQPTSRTPGPCQPCGRQRPQWRGRSRRAILGACSMRLFGLFFSAQFPKGAVPTSESDLLILSSERGIEAAGPNLVLRVSRCALAVKPAAPRGLCYAQEHRRAPRPQSLEQAKVPQQQRRQPVQQLSDGAYFRELRPARTGRGQFDVERIWGAAGRSAQLLLLSSRSLSWRSAAPTPRARNEARRRCCFPADQGPGPSASRSQAAAWPGTVAARPVPADSVQDARQLYLQPVGPPAALGRSLGRSSWRDAAVFKVRKCFCWTPPNLRGWAFCIYLPITYSHRRSSRVGLHAAEGTVET